MSENTSIVVPKRTHRLLDMYKQDTETWGDTLLRLLDEATENGD